MMRSPDPSAPLADRLRPTTLDDLLGQDEIVGPGSLLRRAIDQDQIGSMILWGPPGSGKTTLARIVARRTRARFFPFSAVLAGIKEIKEIMKEAEEHQRLLRQKTILFVDEIHRFNRAQQDAFLPFIERGEIVLIGATTENPSFEVNAALLSRCQVYVLRPLDRAAIRALLDRALADPQGLGGEKIVIATQDLDLIAEASRGDARAALGTLEMVALNVPRNGEAGGEPRNVTRRAVEDALRRGAPYYDKAGEEHFNLISALHKSLRNSDPGAAVYWAARMLESGEDPLYLARRMIRFASEDVGNADPRALTLAVAAAQAVHFLGMPEASDALAQAAVYLATAPKSNAVTVAYNEAREDIRAGKAGAPPLAIRNAPTPLLRELGYGAGYVYAHDTPEGVADLACLPEELQDRAYYRPTDRGFERTIRERMAAWAEIRRRKP